MERNKMLRTSLRSDIWQIAVILLIFSIGLQAVQSKVSTIAHFL